MHEINNSTSGSVNLTANPFASTNITLSNSENIKTTRLSNKGHSSSKL